MSIPVHSDLKPMGNFYIVRSINIDHEGVRLSEVINQVKSQIESITTDFYTKSESDAKYATKTELSSGLSGKVNTRNGYDLISDADKAQIQSNKSSIATNTSRISSNSTEIGQLRSDLSVAENEIASKASQEEVDQLKSDVATKASSGTVSQLQADLNIQTARMNQLVGTVPAGSADEIADARVMMDGETADNIGNAIRSQTAKLNEMIDESAETGHVIITEIHNGSVNGIAGTKPTYNADSNRLRTNFISLQKGDTIKIEPNGLLVSCVIWKGSIGNATGVLSNEGFKEGSQIFTMSENGFLICVFKNSENTDMTPDDFHGKIKLASYLNKLVVGDKYSNDEDDEGFVSCGKIENGSYSGANLVFAQHRIRYDRFIPVHPGDVVRIKCGSYKKVVRIYLGDYRAIKLVRSDTAASSNDEDIPIFFEGYILVIFQSEDNKNISKYDFNGSVKVKRSAYKLKKFGKYVNYSYKNDASAIVFNENRAGSGYIKVKTGDKVAVRPGSKYQHALAYWVGDVLKDAELVGTPEYTKQITYLDVEQDGYVFAVFANGDDLRYPVFLREFDGEIVVLTKEENTSSSKMTKLRVATYNVGDFSGEGYETGSDELAKEMRIAISEVNADLYALQEDVAYFNTEEQSDKYEKVYAMFKNYIGSGTKMYNYKAFLSNYKVESVCMCNYSMAAAHTFFLVGEINIDGKLIGIASIHFDWQDNIRRQEQIRQVRDYMLRYENAIVMGDANPYDCIDDQRQSTDSRYLVDNALWEEKMFKPANGGYINTFTTDVATVVDPSPCDTVYVSGNISINNVAINLKSYMNDHCILYADIVIP